MYNQRDIYRIHLDNQTKFHRDILCRNHIITRSLTNCCCIFKKKIVSEYDQEIPQSQNAYNPVAPRGTFMVNYTLDTTVLSAKSDSDPQCSLSGFALLISSVNSLKECAH